MQTFQDKNSEKQCQDEEGEKTEPRGPTDTEAFNALEVAMEWVQWQDSVDHIQLLHLKISRDMAAEKRMSSLKQKTLKNFFFLLKRFLICIVECM